MFDPAYMNAIDTVRRYRATLNDPWIIEHCPTTYRITRQALVDALQTIKQKQREKTYFRRAV